MLTITFLLVQNGETCSPKKENRPRSADAPTSKEYYQLVRNGNQMDTNILSYVPMSVHWSLPFGYNTILVVVLLLESLRIKIMTQYFPLSSSYHSMRPYDIPHLKEILYFVVGLVMSYCFDSPGEFFAYLCSTNWIRLLKKWSLWKRV